MPPHEHIHGTGVLVFAVVNGVPFNALPEKLSAGIAALGVEVIARSTVAANETQIIIVVRITHRSQVLINKQLIMNYKSLVKIVKIKA